MPNAGLRTQFGDDVINHHTFVIAGDGCFEEGISHEAASLAGHQRLANLICVYDDNHITIDGPTSLAYSDNVGMRFEAYGWNVVHLGEMADDCDGLEAALVAAKAVTDKPTLLILRSHIGAPSPDWTDQPRGPRQPVHGRTGHAAPRPSMGIPDEPFWAPPTWSPRIAAVAAERGAAEFEQWSKRKAASTHRRGSVGRLLGRDRHRRMGGSAADVRAGREASPPESPSRRRSTHHSTACPACWPAPPTSPATPAPSSTGQEPQSFDHPGGRQMYYGIREHAMGSTMVGMAKHGGVLPAGGTFFVFLDYMRPSVRLAALSHAKVVFVWTHDSVGVGEDGPTHQPVEQLATLRAIPHLQVIRPADANETVAAWKAAVAHDGPTALGAQPSVRHGVHRRLGGRDRRGGGPPGRPPAGRARRHGQRGVAVRRGRRATCRCRHPRQRRQHAVVGSVRGPERQLSRTTCCRPGLPVLSVEAGVTFGWERYADESIGIDRFGASAPGNVVMDKLGINVANVVAAATRLAQAKG